MSDSLRPPWTIDCQAPLSKALSRQEYWSEQPFSSTGDLSSPGVKTRSPALQLDSLPSEPPGKPKNTEMGSLSLHQDHPDPGIEPGSPALQVDRRILYQLHCQGSSDYICQNLLLMSIG